jgi:hypothetical protein
MPVKWSSCVWTEGRLSPRGYAALLGERPSTWCTLARTRHWDRSPLVILRNLCEEAIMRGQDGLGDFGAENFPIPDPNRKGRFYNLDAGRGTGGGNNASTRALLAAGPDGPVAGERFEMFREGAEISEVILFLEKALRDKTLAPPLGAKVNAYLDRRGRIFLRDWYERGRAFTNRWSVPGQFERDAELLRLAAEVTRAESK